MRVRKLLAHLSGALAVTAMLGGSAWGASTPIQHLVVIFQENVSFDHYFATYPNAANPGGEPIFVPRMGGHPTPTVNGLSGMVLLSTTSLRHLTIVCLPPRAPSRCPA